MVDDGDSELCTSKKADAPIQSVPEESETVNEPAPSPKPKKVNPSKPKSEPAAPSASIPAQPPAAAYYPYMDPSASQYAAPPALNTPNFYASALPTVPDAEEQEYLSQLLLAWYQAGYAAGRYMMVRQRKQCFVFSKHNEIMSG